MATPGRIKPGNSTKLLDEDLDEFRDTVTDVRPAITSADASTEAVSSQPTPSQPVTAPVQGSTRGKAAVTSATDRVANVSNALRTAEDALRVNRGGTPGEATAFRRASGSRPRVPRDGDESIPRCATCGARCACSACRGVGDGNRSRADSSDDESGVRSTMCGCFVNRILTRLGPDHHDAEDDGTGGGAGEAKPSVDLSAGRMLSVPSTFDAAPSMLPSRIPTKLPAPVVSNPPPASPRLFSHQRFLGLEAGSDDEDAPDVPADKPSGTKPITKGTSTPVPTPVIVPDASAAPAKKGFLAGLAGKVSGSPSGRADTFAVGDDGFVKVESVRKKVKELNHLRLRQCLKGHVKAGETVWVAKFSPDGQYLATAGGTSASGVIRVWRVKGSPGVSAGLAAAVVSSIAPDIAPARAPAHSGSSRESHESPVSTSGSSARRPSSESAKSSSEDDLLRDVEAHSNTVFESKPYREFKGHESYVVDLAWSKTLLLLSASLDKTVRLWHVSRPECLHRFQHPQEVTSVVCHPTDYRYFLTGCLDKKLRIWSLNTGRVALWQPTAEMITSVAFTPDARIVIAGLYNGVCTFYLTDGLRYLTQVECRNRKGSMKRGRKVTGLEFINSGSHLLVTTNDSRLRLISMEDFSMTHKYKGLVNKTCQIRASFDSSGEFIVAGSEDGQVYVWRTHNEHAKSQLLAFNKHKNNSYETFPVIDAGTAIEAELPTKPASLPPHLLSSRPGLPVGASSTVAPTAMKAVTVAVFAPLATLVLSRPPTEDDDRMDPTSHMLLVTADTAGRICVFEHRKLDAGDHP